MFLTLILLWQILNFNNAQHPVHLSVTNVEYKNKSFNISIRLFVDDFQKIIKQNYGVDLNLSKSNELKNANLYINKYITSHLYFYFDNQQVNSKKYILKSREIKDVTLWLNYRIKYPKEIKNVKINNNLMIDLYQDQKNLLIFTYKNIQKALEFNAKTTTISFGI